MSSVKTYSFSIDPSVKTLPGYAPGFLMDIKNNIATDGFFPKDILYTAILYNNYLSSKKSFWVSSSYLPYGLFPVALAPEIIQPNVNSMVLSMLNALNIEGIPLRPIPFLAKNYRLKNEEIWVFRDELDEFMGKKVYTYEDVIKALWLEVNGQ